MSALDHADAIIAALNAGGAHAYLADDIKRMSTKPPYYTEVHVAIGVDENQRVGAFGDMTPVRCITRVVAQSQRNAETERAKGTAALLEKFLTVGGVSFGPIRRETPDDTIDDEGDGFWSGTTAWIYA